MINSNNMFTYLIFPGVSLATINVLYATRQLLFKPCCVLSNMLPCNLKKVKSHNFHATDNQTGITAMAIQENFVTYFL